MLKDPILSQIWNSSIEKSYLDTNRDVAMAVQSGSFTSGWDHFFSCGFKEARPGAPTITPEILDYIKASISQRYWDQRKDSVYLMQVRCLAQFIARNCESVIDVGSNGCPTLDWFPSVKLRVSVDLHVPYVANEIVASKCNFLDYYADNCFDLGLCLQVLEHVADARGFAAKLLSTCKRVIVSVPYKWEVYENTMEIGHIHDPVDEKKMLLWFGRSPDFQIICEERETAIQRLICYYESKNFS